MNTEDVFDNDEFNDCVLEHMVFLQAVWQRVRRPEVLTEAARYLQERFGRKANVSVIVRVAHVYKRHFQGRDGTVNHLHSGRLINLVFS